MRYKLKEKLAGKFIFSSEEWLEFRNSQMGQKALLFL